MPRIAASFLAIALIVAGCQPALTCAGPDALVAHPRGIIVPGVRLGPLLVSTGMWNDQPVARLGWGRPEDLPKFLIARVDPFERSLTLTGRRCEDGRALRFAEGAPWLFGAELTLDEIERRTIASREIYPPVPANVQGIDQLVFGGYFIFTAPGRWRIEARDGAEVVATAIIEVVGPSR